MTSLRRWTRTCASCCFARTRPSLASWACACGRAPFRSSTSATWTSCARPAAAAAAAARALALHHGATLLLRDARAGLTATQCEGARCACVARLVGRLPGRQLRRRCGARPVRGGCIRVRRRGGDLACCDAGASEPVTAARVVVIHPHVLLFARAAAVRAAARAEGSRRCTPGRVWRVEHLQRDGTTTSALSGGHIPPFPNNPSVGSVCVRRRARAQGTHAPALKAHCQRGAVCAASACRCSARLPLEVLEAHPLYPVLVVRLVGVELCTRAPESVSK